MPPVGQDILHKPVKRSLLINLFTPKRPAEETLMRTTFPYLNRAVTQKLSVVSMGEEPNEISISMDRRPACLLPLLPGDHSQVG